MISIIGAGKVGSAVAWRIAEKGLGNVALFDIVEGLAKGEALDIMHSGVGVNVKGSDDIGIIADSEIVIVTASVPRGDMKDRLELMERNMDFLRGIFESIKALAPSSKVIIVSNPVDVMSYLALKVTGFDRKRIIGFGSLLDSRRFDYIISRDFGVSEDAFVLGEHGNSMVPIFSRCRIDGRLLEEMLEHGKINRIREEIVSSGGYVAGLKGGTVHGPASAIAMIVECIINDRKETVPVSAFLEGEYGIKDVCIGVPAVIGKNGIEKIVEIGISKEEMAGLAKSADKIKGILNGIKF